LFRGQASRKRAFFQAICWQLQVKSVTLMVNSAYNGWRMEDAWLDK
jgi:hypothetical protein